MSHPLKIKWKGWVAVVTVLIAALLLARPSSPPRVEIPQRRSPTASANRGNITAPIDQQVPERRRSLAATACAECHPEIVADYERSGMSHSWWPADAAELPLSQSTPEVADTSSGYQYQVLATDGGVSQLETHAELEHQLLRPASYFVGSGKHAIAMVTADNGYLTQMPVAWFRHGEAWCLNPGFELHNHRFDRPITPGCIACHGTLAEHQVPTRNRYALPIEQGIACERCHGDASAHVLFWTSADAATPRREQARAELIHPARLPAERVNDLCLQCHLQGDVTLYHGGSDPFQFQPGDRLQDHRADFLLETESPAALGVASHGAGMLRSRCYIGSGARLTCILCHDPHKPASDFDFAFYDSKCATCHTSESCSRPTDLEEALSSVSCVTCHMPQRPSQEGIHLVFTDHVIPRIKPSAESDRPTAVLRPNTPAVLTSCFPGEEASAADLGAAYVLLHETMGPQLPALKRALPLLREALRKDPEDRLTSFWLGSALVELRQGDQAIERLRELVESDPADHSARFRLALAHELVGDYSSAIGHYEHLVQRVPHWMEPYPRLAQLHLSAQRPDDALRVLVQQLSFRQSAMAHAQLALAKRMAGSTHQAAMESVAEALRLDPRLPTAYLHRATLHLLNGETEQAQTDFHRVLALQPDHPHARQALQNLSALPRD